MCRGFLPLEMLGCARLAEVAFLDCRCLTISPVLGELPALTRHPSAPTYPKPHNKP